MRKEAQNHNLEKKSKSFYNLILKRIIDFFLSFTLIVFLLPLIIVISLVIVFTSGFPVFYTPYRGGYKNKPFKIIKFRTMIKNADKIIVLDDGKISGIGTHEELLNNNEIYKEIALSQLSKEEL